MRHEADLLFLRLCLVSISRSERDGWFVPGQTQILIVQPHTMNGGLHPTK